jgi:hypothetical protein
MGARPSPEGDEASPRQADLADHAEPPINTEPKHTFVRGVRD